MKSNIPIIRTMHEEITSKQERIYSSPAAENLFTKKRISHRKLSLMKQENIKEALESGMFTLWEIRNTLNQRCGYCFKYDKADCHDCPIYKKHHKFCFNLKEWDKMLNAETKAEFMKWHKLWCKKIGLDVYGKEKK